MVEGNTKVVRTERSAFRIVRTFPSEETKNGKGEHERDYRVERYPLSIDDGEMDKTRPQGTISVDKGELETLVGIEMPTYPKCDCGRAADMGDECTYCRHNVDPSLVEE